MLRLDCQWMVSEIWSAGSLLFNTGDLKELIEWFSLFSILEICKHNFL